MLKDEWTFSFYYPMSLCNFTFLMATQRSVSFHTLGCKLNFSETSSISNQFEKAGYQVLPYDVAADIYVINTCSVTDFADRKCRYEVRKSLRNNPDAHVIIIGCYAQLKPKEISEIPGVSLVLGAAEKFNILHHINQLQDQSLINKAIAGDVLEANSFIDAFSFGNRTRSFLKVQDGCNYKCSFCTIPLARGKSRSDTIENAVTNASKIAALGGKEIVLTGVNLGDFGNGTEVIEGSRPKKEALFIDLIKELDKVDQIDRYRISSIEPNLLTQEIIEFVSQSNSFVPHFHIPLQSGSPELLKKMQRRYTVEQYATRIKWIRNYLPNACIGVDVIVGFPGESEALFKETYTFLSELDINYLHVFTYSERENTLAATLDGKIDMGVRKKRNKQLRELSYKKKVAFYDQYKNTTARVLLEKDNNENLISGFTDNYLKVSLPFDETLINTIQEVELGKLHYKPLMYEGSLVSKLVS